MRVGSNPLKGKPAEPLPGILGAVITHLPHRVDYHALRFEVVTNCLMSMRRNAGIKLPILVWDNGSCGEFRTWMIDQYKPEYLILAPNIGKVSAWHAIAGMFPEETILCMSDDDMLYYPNWLQPQLDLLNGFPAVGAVTGYPIRTSQRWGNQTTLAWAQEHAILTIGRYLPEEWERDFSDSIGRDWDYQVGYTANDRDYLIEYNGLKAYAMGHHCQMVTRAGILYDNVSYNGECVGNERSIDNNLDTAGYLRLATTERYARHMGNVIDAKLEAELNEMGLTGIWLT